MTIQKKSLINTLSTTKKAIVASTPVVAEVEAGRPAAKDSVRFSDRKAFRYAKRLAKR